MQRDRDWYSTLLDSSKIDGKKLRLIAEWKIYI